MASARLTTTDFEPSSARFWIKYLSTLRAVGYNQPEFRMAGALSMRELLQTVPQELYDQIYNYTFSTAVNGNIEVDKKTRPPTIMQVDRSTRAKVAALYYSNIFDFSEDSPDQPALRQSWVNGMGLEKHKTRVSYENEDDSIGRWFAAMSPIYHYRLKESVSDDDESGQIIVRVYGSAFDGMRWRTGSAFRPFRVWSGP